MQRPLTSALSAAGATARLLHPLLAALVMALLPASSFGAIVFDDGETHTVADTSLQSQHLIVRNGTTLKVVDGAAILSVALYDTSRIEMSGGTLDGTASRIEGWGNATIEISGGAFGPTNTDFIAGNVQVRENARLTISGGAFGGPGERSGQVVGVGDAVVTISGGSFGGTGKLSGFIEMRERNELTVTGGHFGAAGQNSGKFDVRIYSTVTVWGGTFDGAGVGAGRLSVVGMGTVHKASFINGARIESLFSGFVRIPGCSFSLPFGPIADLDGSLTGILADGSAFSADYYRGFNPNLENGTIELVEVPCNEAPIADAGPDQTVECTGLLTPVPLDGSASADPDGDTLIYEWSAPAGTALDDPSSASPTGQFPVGSTTVTLTVTDGNGGVDTDDVLVIVEDTTSPVIECTTDLIALLPPNHTMRSVQIRVAVTDECADLELTCRVLSSEPDDANGDGEFTGDVDGVDGYTGPVTVDLTFDPLSGCFLGEVELRAERDGAGSSRTYSIDCDVTDSYGNTANAGCVVVVPHDRRKK